MAPSMNESLARTLPKLHNPRKDLVVLLQLLAPHQPFVDFRRRLLALVVYRAFLWGKFERVIDLDARGELDKGATVERVRFAPEKHYGAEEPLISKQSVPTRK